MATPKPTPPPNADNPEQSRRFIDMARDVEADEAEGALDRAFRKIINSPKSNVGPSDAVRRKPHRDD